MPGCRLSARASGTEKLFQCLSGTGEEVNHWRLLQTEQLGSWDLLGDVLWLQKGQFKEGFEGANK